MIKSNRDTGDKNVVPLEHDGMLFCAYLSAILRKEDFIGAYIDRNGLPRRVRIKSLYGELVISALDEDLSKIKQRIDKFNKSLQD